ncbi:hypothetical protein, partial [Kineococcus sp. SYSU DK006]|uniref:hypothetical protein n=1 Tax=Kineococcus sp. SYSU DK006 TaxID=3383127 RepID=UPI003D7ED189
PPVPHMGQSPAKSRPAEHHSRHSDPRVTAAPRLLDAHPRKSRGRLIYIAVLLAGAVSAFGVLQGIGWLSGAPQWRRAAVMTAGIVLIGTPLSTWIGTAVTGRVREHLATTDRLECSFRIVEGHQDGLTKQWRAGIAALSPGHVTFVHTVGGLRFLRRRPVTFEVQADESGLARKLRGIEVLLVTPEAQAVRLSTPTAVLEWAITPAERIPWALQRVHAR